MKHGDDHFGVSRMKRQAYNPKGILDIVKLLAKQTAVPRGLFFSKINTITT